MFADTARATARSLSLIGTLLLALILAILAGCGGGAVSAPPPPTASPTPVPPVIYVAVGASDAVGVGAANPNTQGYVPLLISQLPAHSQALNLGISGNTIHPALTNELPAAIAAHPTLVTVWMAGNDFKGCTPLDQYGADLNTLLGQLQTQTRARVFVANLPDMSLLPAVRQAETAGGGPCLQGKTNDQVRALTEQWNTVIAAAVAQHGDFLVDLFHSDLAAHPELIYSDGFHPSSAGYQLLAAVFWAQIQAHGNLPA